MCFIKLISQYIVWANSDDLTQRSCFLGFGCYWWEGVQRSGRGEDCRIFLDSFFFIQKITLHLYLKTPTCMCFGFSSGHVWMWELDHKESWSPKNWSFWRVVLEKILESPLDGKEIQLVNPKGNRPWIFTGRIDAEAVAPILWLADAKSRLVGEDPDAGKDWRQEKGMTEDRMVG